MKKNTKPTAEQNETGERQVFKLICQNPDCRKGFSTVIFWRRYCSNACRQADFKKRRKAGN